MPNLPEQFKPYWVPEKQVKQRETTTKTKFYQSMPWRKLRAVKVRLNPLCESCLKVNKIEKVKQVDHIKPINQADPFNTEGGQLLDQGAVLVSRLKLRSSHWFLSLNPRADSLQSEAWKRNSQS